MIAIVVILVRWMPRPLLRDPALLLPDIFIEVASTDESFDLIPQLEVLFSVMAVVMMEAVVLLLIRQLMGSSLVEVGRGSLCP